MQVKVIKETRIPMNEEKDLILEEGKEYSIEETLDESFPPKDNRISWQLVAIGKKIPDLLPSLVKMYGKDALIKLDNSSLKRTGSGIATMEEDYYGFIIICSPSKESYNMVEFDTSRSDWVTIQDAMIYKITEVLKEVETD